jgi:hypothetical protein
MGEEGRMRKRKLNVYLLEEEYEVLIAKTVEADMSISEYIRNVILYGAAHKTTYFSKEMQNKILTELSRIGNNVNQFARVANSVKTVNQDDVENIIAAIADINDMYFKYFNQ